MDSYLANTNAVLYLYGSRTDDSLNGGDIDLLLFGDKNAILRVQDARLKILVDIKAKIGDQKIDFSFHPFKAKETNAFVEFALEKSIKLYQWPNNG